MALGGALFGALVNGYVNEMHYGERLANIEVRLTQVEHNLATITCLEVVGTVACDKDADKLKRGGL